MIVKVTVNIDENTDEFKRAMKHLKNDKDSYNRTHDNVIDLFQDNELSELIPDWNMTIETRY